MAQKNNIFKRGQSWYVRFTVNGRDVKRSAGRSKQAAQELLVKLRREAERSAAGLPRMPQSVKTLAEWGPKYMEWAKVHKRSWKRDEWCLAQLVEVFGTFRLTDITKPRVEAFMRDRRQEVAAATVNRQVALLRKVLSHALEAGEIDVHPLQRIRLLQEAPARSPVLDLDDEQKLIAVSPPWFGFMIRMAVLTGCRQAELRALKWRHINFDAGTLTVEDSKSGDSRQVIIHPSILPDLHARRQMPEAPVIVMPNGRVPSAPGINHAMQRATKKIGRVGFRFHDLRHIAGSRLLAEGASLPEVASFLGHKTLSIARRYAHVTQTRLRDLISKMPASSTTVDEDESPARQ